MRKMKLFRKVMILLFQFSLVGGLIYLWFETREKEISSEKAKKPAISENVIKPKEFVSQNLDHGISLTPENSCTENPSNQACSAFVQNSKFSFTVFFKDSRILIELNKDEIVNNESHKLTDTEFNDETARWMMISGVLLQNIVRKDKFGFLNDKTLYFNIINKEEASGQNIVVLIPPGALKDILTFFQNLKLEEGKVVGLEPFDPIKNKLFVVQKFY